MFIRAPRLSARVSRIRIASLDLFKSHVKRFHVKQKDYRGIPPYKGELVKSHERGEEGGGGRKRDRRRVWKMMK